MIELKGGTLNPVTFEPETGVVTKGFVIGNGVSEKGDTRKHAEIFSLQTIPFTPIYFGGYDTKVMMSFVEGEKQLDEMVTVLSESERHAVFSKAGETLAFIHTFHNHAVPEVYHVNHKKKVFDVVALGNGRLKKVGFDSLEVLRYLEESYDTHEIDRWGMTWIHGDYWLPNIIGELKNGRFNINGVIDWEMAKIGSPYEDFGLVRMSIEDVHEGSAFSFWRGYKRIPNRNLQSHYAIIKILEWMAGEDETNQFDSLFYKQKFSMMREAMSGV